MMRLVMKTLWSSAFLGFLGGSLVACAPEQRNYGAAGGEGGSTQLDFTLIDDMEANTGSIIGNAGTQGPWFIYNDGTGLQNPLTNETTPFAMSSPGADGSKYAAKTWGSGFTGWGAGFGFDLSNPGGATGVSGPYNADEAGFKGISFKAKVGAGAHPKVRVSIGDSKTIPEGGICNDAATEADPNRCNDFFGHDLTLSTDWAEYHFLFDELTQQGWGNNGLDHLDTTALWLVHWEVDNNAPTFEIWVDDVAFYK